MKLTISDLSGANTRVLQIDPKPGINRYYWDLTFDAKPYSTEQKAHIESTVQRLVCSIQQLDAERNVYPLPRRHKALRDKDVRLNP